MSVRQAAGSYCRGEEREGGVLLLKGWEGKGGERRKREEREGEDGRGWAPLSEILNTPLTTVYYTYNVNLPLHTLSNQSVLGQT